MTTPYRAYLVSDEWRDRKRRYYDTHKKECRACGSIYRIHLHHKTYRRLGNERDADLVPLCDKCHKGVHNKQKREKRNLWLVTEDYIRNKRKRLKNNNTTRRPSQTRKKKKRGSRSKGNLR